MYSYLYIDRLQPITLLFNQRESALEVIRQRIISLGANNEGIPFTQALTFIKKKVLLTEVRIVKSQVVLLNSCSKVDRHCRYRVYFDIEGSRELMRSMPESGPPPGNSQRIYQPIDGNLFIDFNQQSDDEAAALAYATAEMDTTFNLIPIVNDAAAAWNTKMKAQAAQVLALYDERR